MRSLSVRTVLVALTAAGSAYGDCAAPYTDLSGASAKVYTTTVLWFNGQRSWCWPFADRANAVIGSDVRVKANSIISLTYPDGASAGAPIVNVLPCQDGYSDAWLKFTGVVEYSTVNNTYRDFASVNASGIALKKAGYFNYPIVPPGSKLSDWSGYEVPAHDIVQAWNNGNKVYYFDFGAIPQDNILDYVPTADSIAVYASDSHGIPVNNGFSVVDAAPGSPKYTGFYSMLASNVTGSPLNYFRSYDNFTSNANYTPSDLGMAMNCPTSYLETFLYRGNPPAAPATTLSANAAAIPPPAPPVDPSSKPCYQPYLTGPKGSYSSKQGYSGGKQFGCWNMGSRSSLFAGSDNATALAPVLQPVYNDQYVGTATPTLAGNPVFNYLPCQSYYSDAVEVWYVPVDTSVPFNFRDKFITWGPIIQFTDYATLHTAFSSGAVSGIFNYAVVEPGSTIAVASVDAAAEPALASVATPKLMDGWYQNTQVFYFNFGPVPTASSTTAFVTNGKAVFPVKADGAGVNVLSGKPVFDAAFGDNAYTGFYGMSTTASTNGTLTSIASVTSATTDIGSILNCPYAYFASS
ncbi:hypothetical protein HK101_008999 [Irineochytrium annulatum]|nr:hypothetical protein HK101_008999 [Irineochytrium annulatum]